MAEFYNLMIVALVFFSTTISPGPATLATATIAMSTGRRGALVFSAGLTLGHATWGVLVSTGLLASPDDFSRPLLLIKVCGGAYFLWLAGQSILAAIGPAQAEHRPTAQGRFFIKGVALNLLNPTIFLIWISVLSLGPVNYSALEPFIIAIAMCFVIAFMSYAIVAYVFSLAGAMRVYAKLGRWIQGSAAAVFAAAGAVLLGSVFAT